MKSLFTWALLGFSLAGFSQNPSTTVGDLSKRFTYKTLSSYQKTIFDEFVDDEFPAGKDINSTLDGNAWTRNKSRLAEALLYRNSKGDKQNAAVVLTWLFGLQNLDVNDKDYGVWKGSSNHVGNYDQNMREFIGTDLLVIHRRYRHLLPAEVVKSLEASLIHAARGALKRNVNPDYNNISIMSSLMMEYVGNVFKIGELTEAGVKKAEQIFANYHVYNTLCEYNTPTYYGVDFVGLALWREMAHSKKIRDMGITLEKELWLEVATFYNANLKNMSGPFLRGYGMDMQKYNAIAGIWMAVAVDDEKVASIPRKQGGKYFECSFIVPILDLGIEMPQKALAQVKRFDTPRFISRDVPNYYEGDKLKKVTAMINADWMMGGLWGNRKISNILKTGTIHWKTASGEIGWLLVPGEGKTNVRVSETQMSIYLADKDATQFSLYVYAPTITPKQFADTQWALPDMTLGIHTSLKRLSAEFIDKESFQKVIESSNEYSNAVKVIYEVPASWNSETPLLEITPKK